MNDFFQDSDSQRTWSGVVPDYRQERVDVLFRLFRSKRSADASAVSAAGLAVQDDQSPMDEKSEKVAMRVIRVVEALFYGWGVVNLGFGAFGLGMALVSEEVHPTLAWRSLAIFWPLLEMVMGVLYLLWGVGMHRRWTPTPWLVILTVVGQHWLSRWYWETFRIAGVSRWLGWFPVLLTVILMLYVAFLMRRLPSLRAKRI